MQEVYVEQGGSPDCNMTMSHNCTSHNSSWIETYSGTAEAAIVPCVFACILLIGVLGNSLLILSFTRHKSLNTLHNALVVNLASGDFIFLLVSLPFNSLWYTIPFWSFGVTVCKITHFAESLALTVGITTLSVLSIERCLIVTGKKLWRKKKRGPVLLTLAIWLLALIVSVPDLISANVTEKIINNETYPFCNQYSLNSAGIYPKAHVVARFIVFFCLPLVVIASAYTIIAVRLLLRAFPLSQTPATTNKPRHTLRLNCLHTRRPSDNILIQSIKPEGAVNACSKTNTNHLPVKRDREENKTGKVAGSGTAIEQTSNPLPAQDEDKSASPDSCTQITEIQQTPVLPYSFVYTGPISTCAYPNYDPPPPKENADTARNTGNSESSSKVLQDNTTSQMLKETTPLNPLPSTGGTKRGHKNRKQTMLTKRRRLAFTVLTLIFAFIICWTPRYIYLLWYHVMPGEFNYFWYVFKIVSFCLSFSYSAVNPLVFYVLDSSYRSFVNKALCTICLKKCRSEKSQANDGAIIIAERDYNATIAMTDIKSKSNVTEV